MSGQSDTRSSITARIRRLMFSLKRYYLYFVHLLVAAAAVIATLMILIPRPAEGYVSYHPLAIATTYVIAGACWAFVIAVLYFTASAALRWGVSLLRRNTVVEPEELA